MIFFSSSSSCACINMMTAAAGICILSDQILVGFLVIFEMIFSLVCVVCVCWLLRTADGQLLGSITLDDG